MFINKNYSNLKKVADENSSNYSNAKPFPSIVFDNFFKEEILNEILNDFPNNINQRPFGFAGIYHGSKIHYKIMLECDVRALLAVR